EEQERINNLERQLKIREHNLSEKEKKLHDEVDKEKARLLEEYEDKLRKILKEARDSQSSIGNIVTAKKKLEELEEAEEIELFSDEIKVGDYVEIPSMFADGRVIKISGNKVLVNSSEGLQFTTQLDHLRKIREPEKKKKPMSGKHLDESSLKKSLSLELNLIGQRGEEAKLNLQKYLDDCLLCHYKRVRIIHGFGNGVLRKIVQEYCKANKSFIAKYESADGAEGGGGATIIYLK
ncbi:MAG: Smr/MutS family protein, partial [Bacilli bacterium]|nr:Smr/MutS family protein [Bacilli bacterium]